MSQPAEHDREGLAWQRGIRDRSPEIYLREVDPRFAPVVEQVIRRAALAPGQHVLALGAGGQSQPRDARRGTATRGGLGRDQRVVS
jgi:hypothetical protein